METREPSSGILPPNTYNTKERVSEALLLDQSLATIVSGLSEKFGTTVLIY